MKIALLGKRIRVGTLALSLTVAASVLMTAAISVVEAAPSESIRVSNLEHGPEYGPDYLALSMLAGQRVAQSFCTANVGATLTRVRLWGQDHPDSDATPTLTIYSDNYGVPGRGLHTLTTPSIDQDLETTEEFASSGFGLAPFTRYWVVVSQPGASGELRLAVTDVAAETDPGWELGNRMYYKSGNNRFWYTSDFSANNVISMAIYANSDPPSNSPPVLYNSNCQGPENNYQFRVDENVAEETLVGTVLARDIEDDSLTFSLGGPDIEKFNRLFVLNTTTGAFSVKPGASINYEQVPPGSIQPAFAYHTYRVTVSVTDGKDASGTVESEPTVDDIAYVTIKVNNLNEPGFAELLQANNQPLVTPMVGEEFISRVRDADRVSMTLDRHLARADSASGTFTVFETNAPSEYTPVAADEGKFLRVTIFYFDNHCSYRTSTDLDATCTKSVEVTTQNAVAPQGSGQNGMQRNGGAAGSSNPAAPVFEHHENSITFRVEEDSTQVAPIARLPATDPNNDTLTFSVSGTDSVAFSSAFDFSPNSGEIRVKSGSSLDYEGKQSYSIAVHVTDGVDGSGNAEDAAVIDDTISVTIRVTNRDEPGTVTLSASTPVVGSRITGALSDPDGIFMALSQRPIRWQWLISGVQSNSAFVPIEGATSDRYIPVEADLGKRLKARARYADFIAPGKEVTSSATSAVTATAAAGQTANEVNNAATGTPTVVGTPQVGQTLTASTADTADADGMANATFTYQWLADDAQISGATGSTYTLVDTDAGKTIKVRVDFTDDVGFDESLTSAGVLASPPNSPPTGVPTISGTAQVGETLAADTSSIADEDGLDNVSYSYQWLADDSDIGGATGGSYTLVEADEGRAIKVRVSFTDDRNNPETLTSAATAAVEEGEMIPLTATIPDAPSSHDGSNTFTFELRFSEEFTLSYKTLRDHAFTVTGGEVVKARRLEKGRNVRWEISVVPDGDGPVTVVLPATTDCEADGAVCTDDGRKLSQALEFEVPGLSTPEISLNTPEITSGSSFSVDEGATQVATLRATDGDTPAANLTWSISGGDDEAKFAVTAAGALSFAAAKDYETPDDADTDGVYEVTVQVSDGGRTDSADLTVTLTNVNEAPTADAGTDQADVKQGAAVTLSGSGADPDSGDTLSYAWTQSGTPAVTLSDSAAASPTFTAPAGLSADTALTFTLRVTDARGLYAEDSVTVAISGQSPLTPLTARARDVPSAHDGSTTFTFELRFSEEPADGFSYKTLRDNAFTVTSGDVTKVRRLEKGKNVRWEISVTPDGNGTVTIVLPATTDCDADGAVCTDDGRMLSNRLEITVPGP